MVVSGGDGVYELGQQVRHHVVRVVVRISLHQHDRNVQRIAAVTARALMAV